MRRWFDRRFSFEHLGEADAVFLIERLRGAPARVEEHARDLAPERLARRQGDAWSIQEHVGHLVELDALHDARLDDYLAGASVLRAADLRNRGTEQGRYNQRPFDEIARAFRGRRGRLLARLDAWDEGKLSLSAIHPRLSQPMRLLDMLYFAAEHDDHHLATIAALRR